MDHIKKISIKCLAHGKYSVNITAYGCLFLLTYLMCKFLEDRDFVLFIFESLVPSTGSDRWKVIINDVE